MGALRVLAILEELLRAGGLPASEFELALRRAREHENYKLAVAQARQGASDRVLRRLLEVAAAGGRRCP